MRVRKYIQYLVDGLNIAKALIVGAPGSDAPLDRVCRTCAPRPPDVVVDIGAFEDSGLCSRCGDVVTAADSVGVVASR